jgi:hypothetical protein
MNERTHVQEGELPRPRIRRPGNYWRSLRQNLLPARRRDRTGPVVALARSPAGDLVCRRWRAVREEPGTRRAARSARRVHDELPSTATRRLRRRRTLSSSSGGARRRVALSTSDRRPGR